jgi:hypothetical protein
MGPGRDDYTTGGCIENFDEGNDKCVNSGQQTKVSADLSAAPTTDEIAEISCREKKEGDPNSRKMLQTPLLRRKDTIQSRKVKTPTSAE